jgi:hypothetical protein
MRRRLAEDGMSAIARVWLKHDSMAFDPHNPFKPPQPGINGVRNDSRTGFLYYTSTQRKLFMRVRVDPDTSFRKRFSASCGRSVNFSIEVAL